MPFPRSGALWQRRLTEMRACREFIVPAVRHPGEGYRVEVLDLVHVPGVAGIVWMSLGTGQWRVPKQLHEWAALVQDELADQWEIDQLFPFYARFGRVGDEFFVDFDRPV